MITYIIRLDGQFVLAHNDDLPLEKIEAALKAKYDAVKFSNETFTSVVVEIEQSIELAALEKELEAMLAAAYPDANDAALEVSPYTAPPEEEKPEKPDTEVRSEQGERDDARDGEAAATQAATSAEQPEEGSFEELLSGYRAKTGEAQPAESVADVMKKIKGLVAADGFKKLAAEIEAVAPALIGGGMTDVFAHRSYLFSINDGYGLSTCLELFASLLSATGLMKLASNPVTEIKLGAVKDEDGAFGAARKVIEENGGATRIMCVDISEWMNDTESVYFKKFLRSLDDSHGKLLVVFRLPFVDNYILEKVRCSINDLCFVSVVSFPPFNGGELRKCAAIHLKKYGLSMTPAAWKAFDKRVAEERCDGKFYGLRTVKKVMMELIYDKQLSNVASGKTDGKIDGKTAAALCGKQVADEDGYGMLRGLVGSQAIIDRVNEIVAQIELAMASGGERPCIHMRFVGNPGTGKTTVARILGKILKEKGILRVGDFHECRGRDLCGIYVGTTAPKTASICRDAYGSVLFIDEAYSLYRGGGVGNDYGREALDTLIAEMENHRTDFVVIMAGYTDEMKTLMEGNSGLASRMPYTIEFPNFTRDQLFDIYVSMVGSGNYVADKKTLDAVRAYIDKLPEEFITAKEFSNARFVRNLFERTTAKAALRMQLDGKPVVGRKLVLTKDDFDRAISDGEFKIEEQAKRKIGFNPIG